VKFSCDDNLGKLAKYLRILGFDTLFKEPIEDADLLRLAASEERFLLTRDHQLLSKTHPYGILVIELDEPLEQLRFVISSLGLAVDPAQLFHRCSICNTVCETIDKSQAENHVFPFILKTKEIIKQCPSCKRYYWKGTHYKRLLRELKSAIPEKALTSPWPEE
jgi:hypothetical protein